TIGVEVRDAIMQQKSAPAEQVMPVYAESIGLPFVELSDVEIDESLLPNVPAVTARQQSCVPLLVADGRVLLMAPHMLPPEIEDLLRLRFGMPVRLVLATPGDINQVIAKYYSREAAQAELSAGPAKIAAKPAAAAAEKPAAAPQPKQRVSKYSLSPEERAELKKKQTMTCLMAFNFTVILVVFGLYMFTRYFMMHPYLSMLGGVACGGIGAGITYVVTELKG
ncbi:MAG: hypothetical protein ACREHD_05795, partial [Pirellulales bacterium]